MRTPSPVSTRTTSVREDWRSPLPEDKFNVYRAHVQKLEYAYAMFSVELNEAFGLRQIGSLAKAYQAICITPALCSLLSEPLAGLLRAMLNHAKHYGTVPNTAPLDTGNFLGGKAQRSAGMSSLLSRVLLTQRSQFLHKMSTLQELVEDLDKDFRETAEELTCGALPMQPNREWEALDETHYDLNTCLRESIVILKSFLMVLPDGQLAAFHQSVLTQSRGCNAAPTAKHGLARPRRMAPIGGE